MYYSLHNRESTLAKMHVRPCQCSAQGWITSLGVKGLFLSQVPPLSHVLSYPIILECAQHAYSSGSSPLLFLPPGILSPQLPARLVPLPLHNFINHHWLPSLKLQTTPPFSCLLNFSLQPSLSAAILYSFHIWLSDFPYLQCKVHEGRYLWLLCLYPHNLEKFLAHSKPSINICWINEWLGR